MKWWQTILTSVGGLISREGGVIDKAMDLISERTEDIDKRNAAILELTRMQHEADRDPVWLRAIANWTNLTTGPRIAISVMIWAHAAHMLGRMVLWGFVVYIGGEALASGKISMEDFGALAAGPALYTLIKGKGK